MKDLMSYIPKKYRSLITDLYRENHIDGHTYSVVMEWEDGFCRSLVCDSISELQWAVKNTAENREFEF